MKTHFATPYDQNPVRVAMATRNIRKKEGLAVSKVIGALISLQLAALYIWNSLA